MKTPRKRVPSPNRLNKGKKQAVKPTGQSESDWDPKFSYRALFEQTEDCVFLISFDLRYIAVNPQAVYLLGYSEEELIGKPVDEVMYLDIPASAEAILGDDANLFERLMRRKDGSIFPVEIRTTIVYDDNGSPAYVQSIARDITERKAAELSLTYHNRILTVINDAATRLLRSSDIQKEISNILGLLGSGIDLTRCAIIKARDGKIFGNGVDICFEWKNPSAAPIDLPKLIDFLLLGQGKGYKELFIEAEIFSDSSAGFPPISIAFVPILETGRAWGFLGLLRPDAYLGWAPVYRDAIRTASNIIGAALQRLSSEERIVASEEHSRTILAALPDLIIRADQFGTILDYSARKDHPLYMPRETVNGKNLTEIWSDEIRRQIFNSTSEKFTLPAEVRKEFNVPGSNNIYEARLDTIGATEMLIVIRDVSDQARLNQMKSDFINRASHELRTPLTTAILMCDLIQNSTDPVEKAEYWQILNSELNRQKALIDRLLMAGRLESGRLTLEPEALDLIAVLEESALSVKSIAKKKNIEIVVSTPPPPLLIWGDKSGLQQVFINLINNATKFSPEGSRIGVEAVKEGDKVHISISDRGMGIPPEDLPNLFERFFRARNVTLAEIPGSGVGLYIVKSIVQELEGTIDIKSEINKGTTFIVTLLAMD